MGCRRRWFSRRLTRASRATRISKALKALGKRRETVVAPIANRSSPSRNSGIVAK